MSDEIPIDHLRTWIGKKDHQTDIITPELVKRFNATLGGYTEINSEIPLGIPVSYTHLTLPTSDLV